MTRALVSRGVDAPLEVVDIELPDVGPGDVRVRTAAAGVCHSDLSMLDGTLTPTFPLVPGHEAAGVVETVGADVDDLTVGTHVVFNWAPACRRCWFCLRGEPWLCAAVEGVVTTPGARLDGAPVHHALGVGAFAEAVVVPRRAVVAVPGELALDLAALLGCAVLTGVGAVRNTAMVRPGEAVVVIGLGGVGLSAVAGAAWAGAGPVVAVDVSPDKEALARELDATHFLPAGDGVPRSVRALTGGRGADHALECVGRPETIRTAWRCARRGGHVVVVGVGSRTAEVSFSPLELFHSNRTLTSSVYGAGDPDRDVPLLAEHVRSGALRLAPLVSDRIGLDGVTDAFDRMRRGQGARSVVVFDPPLAGSGG